VEDVRPDVVLLDIMMPGLDGCEVCRRLKLMTDVRPQVVMVSALTTANERMRAYECGADDYLIKPVDHHELFTKCRLHSRLCQALDNVVQSNEEVRKYSDELRRLVVERTRDVQATQDVAVFAMAKLADSRDPETGDHLQRMRNYSVALAEQLRRDGQFAEVIDDAFIDDLFRSSPLHDIGKVGVSDAILLKPGRLTPAEFERMKDHATIGANTLDQIVRHSPSASFLKMAAIIARQHHERFDGTGYPDGRRGHDIALPARIVALADVYDALTSNRVYKEAYEPLVAKELIEAESGRHFDPVIVAAFSNCFENFLYIQQVVNRSSSLDLDEQRLVAAF
jgi:putative two-component system response regulator